MIRKASPSDVPKIKDFLRQFSDRGDLLPRTLADLYGQFRDYFINAQFRNETVRYNKKLIAIYEGTITGTAALHVCWEGTGEIRSLAVRPELQKLNIGKSLVQQCLKEAVELGLKRVFVLTLIPDYFIRNFGFKIIDRNELPPATWGECVACPRFPDCNEIPMMVDI